MFVLLIPISVKSCYKTDEGIPDDTQAILVPM